MTSDVVFVDFKILISIFHFRVAEAFHQTERFKITCLDEQLEKLQADLKEAMPWRTKTASDGLVVKFNDKYYSCIGMDGDNFFQLDYNRKNFFQPLEGFYVIVHSPDEYPVDIGSEYNEIKAVTGSVSITPEMFMLDDDLKSWPIEKRNCYLPGDRNLTFFRIYTKGNCKHECLSKAIEEQCGCLPFYVIGQ